MASTNADKVQKAYIAYYGRPADPGGLNYWVGQLDEGVKFDIMLKAFGTSDEAVTLFGNKNPEETIQTLFQQILGRTPDAGGLEFYVGKLNDGSMTGITIAQNVLDGATGDDAAIVTNKLAVANAFNKALDTADERAAYTGATAVVTLRNMLATVDETTVPASFDVNTSIAGLVSAAAVAAFKAAAVNFNAAVATYNAAFATASTSKKVAAAATWSEVSSSAVNGYQVNIDFEGKIDGIAFDGGLAKGYDLVLGSNTTITGFEDGILGMDAGQTKDITVTFPENYHDSELAGKEATFTIKANTVSKVNVTDVALLTASQAAAVIALIDATALSAAAIAASNAAAKLTILSAATSSTTDNATAATAVSQTAAVTASAATAAASAAEVKTTADNALEAAFAIAEPIKTAAFDAAFVDYDALAVAFNTASATALASKTAAKTAATTATTTATDVELYTRSQTAAAIAVTDATAMSSAAIAASNAAATLTTLSAATSSIVDDATAATAASQTAAVTAAAAAASATAAEVKTTADNALAAAFAIAEPIKTAAFNAATVDFDALAVAYNTASATAFSSKTAAEIAATTVTDVELSTASQTAAEIAVTDATAMSSAAIAASNAAATLTTLSAATSSIVDDATAATAVSQTAAATAAATAASATAAAMKTTADKASAVATAAEATTSSNLAVTTHTDSGYEVFVRNIDVLGINVYAANGVAESKLIHAAHVLAEYLDNDEDGVVDNQLVVDAMIASKGSIGIWQTEGELDIYDGLDFNNLTVIDVETRPDWHINNHTGLYDASLEEIMHSITMNGYANAYPEIFGEAVGSAAANAMDIPRGGSFIQIPEEYPESAWYIYKDETADYKTMITEYMYWGLTSTLGAQDNQLAVIGQEWKLSTAELVRTGDPTLYSLLTDDQYKFPTHLLDGAYAFAG